MPYHKLIMDRYIHRHERIQNCLGGLTIIKGARTIGKHLNSYEWEDLYRNMNDI